MWHAGGALGNSVAIRKIKFWDNEQICVSGFFSSLHHLKVYLSLANGSEFPIEIKSSPHYHLAKYIITSYSDKEVNCEEVYLPGCARRYMNYIIQSTSCEAKEAQNKMQNFMNLIASITKDMQSLQPWRGEIVCTDGHDPDALMVIDGFHRFAILAALGYEVIPTSMYIGPAEKIMAPSW